MPLPRPFRRPRCSVVAGVVAQHDVPIYLSGVGTVIAYNTDIVRAQIQGQLISINFTEGQTVHAGDLLAQIDPRPYQALIDQYTGNLERDQAQLVNAQANLTRYNHIGRQGLGHSAVDRNPEGAGGAVAGGNQGRPGADRCREGAAQLHAPDVADRRRGRDSSDRRGQHHQPVNDERPRRRHADQSDFADLHAPGDKACRKSSSNSKRPGRRSRFSPTARTTRRCWIKACSASSTTRSCRQRARSSSRRILPTRCTGSGPANSSMRGCSSIQGMTA